MIAVFSITQRGYRTGVRVSEALGAVHYCYNSVKHEPQRAIPFSSLSVLMSDVFHKYRAHVFVMSAGIVTRVIAPFVQNKHTDPAVVVHDEVGRYCISLLSGHEGGANELCYVLSSITGAEPVVTTATDSNRFYICGIGCKRGIDRASLLRAIHEGCTLAGITTGELRCLASGWLKQKERALVEVARELDLYIRFIPRWIIQWYYQQNPFLFRSERVKGFTGVYGIAEPCALLSGRNTELVLPRRVFDGVTVAIAKEHLGQWC